MSLDNLIRVVSAPVLPADVPDQPDWKHAEAALGARLPRDYKDYIERFGSGRFNDFFSVVNPFAAEPNLNLLHFARSWLEAFRLSDWTWRHPLFPEPGGLLPFGATDNGDFLLWVTRGQPEDWHVVVCEARGDLAEEYRLDVTDFLAGILSGAIRSKLFPDDWGQHKPQFEPDVPAQ